MIGIGNLIVGIGTLIAIGLLSLFTILINVGIVIVALLVLKYITKLIIKDMCEKLNKVEESKVEV